MSCPWHDAAQIPKHGHPLSPSSTRHDHGDLGRDQSQSWSTIGRRNLLFLGLTTQPHHLLVIHDSQPITARRQDECRTNRRALTSERLSRCDLKGRVAISIPSSESSRPNFPFRRQAGSHLREGERMLASESKYRLLGPND